MVCIEIAPTLRLYVYYTTISSLSVFVPPPALRADWIGSDTVPCALLLAVAGPLMLN